MSMTNVVGIEISEGISKKTGKPYSMGTLHVIERLAPPMGTDTNVAAGFAATKYECDPILLRVLEKAQFPLKVDVTFEKMIRFGERTEVVVDIKGANVVSKQA